MPKRSIEEVLDNHTADWLALPGVVGTAVGESDGRPCISIYVVRKTAELAAILPATVEDHPIRIDEIGDMETV